MRNTARKAWTWIWLARLGCMLCLCLLACGRSGAQAGGELRVAAAADLTRAFTEVGQAFEKQTGQRVTLIFGSSGQLAQQIENGAPFDVFASANEEYVARLDTKHLVLSDTRHVYAMGKLVMWTRRGGLLPPSTLAELADPRYARIAIANPQTAPYGTAAKQALEKVGVWAKVQSKLVTGENIQQAFQFAASGNADIALVSRSLTMEGGGNALPVSPTLYTPLRQTLAVLQSSSHAPLARRFVDFVVGRQGQAILKKYGFEEAKAESGKRKVGVLLSAPKLKVGNSNPIYFPLSAFALSLT